MDNGNLQLDKNEVMLGLIGFFLFIALISRLYKIIITIT